VGERHWDEAYGARGADGVSWFEPAPRTSLALIDALGVSRDAAALDVGAGTSFLPDRLLERGFSDITLLDLSTVALAQVRDRLAGNAALELVHADLLTWRPGRRYDLWHDRAVLHFLVDEEKRAAYYETLRGALAAGGAVILATFGPDAPDRCSGLPVLRYDAAELVAFLGEDFELVESRLEEHVTPGGTVQPLTWVSGRLAAVRAG
jgi:trans-aconitate methyltransferase